METKHGKHILKEDKQKRAEKYRPQTKRTDNDDSRWVLESLTPSISSDSGVWTPSHGFDYKPKLLEDPRNNQSSKENIPLLEPIPIPLLNVEEVNFPNRTDKLLGKDHKWETHVAQQVPLPRTRSPCPSINQTGSMEQLETMMEDDMDIRDLSERPVNDLRPSKPPRKTTVICQNLIPPPGCPDYVAMNHAVMGIPKPTLPEIRLLLLEKKNVSRGWPTCLPRSPPKTTFQNNDIYARSIMSSKNLYEEPQKMKMQEEQGPKEKICMYFISLI